MAIRFSLNQEGVEFKVKVTDCTSDTPIDKNNITSQKIVFYKPDGTRFEKDALLEDDPLNFGQSFVVYQDPTGTSILDSTGDWEYDAQIVLNPGNKVETSQRRVIWVS